MEKDQSILQGYKGMIVPGGFGGRDVEGKITAIKDTRENKIPFLVCVMKFVEANGKTKKV